ncbi:MAG: DUF86 domain-containing protein [Chloroflexia bacterium]|nr:DUF86 domain-containing protein [Chloroflexia bacterium]
MNPRVVRRLLDALEAARNILQFTDGQTAQSYGHARLIHAAVQHELMIIGEALNAALRAEPHLTRKIPTLLEWVGLRNVLIHVYSDVNPRIVWKTATTEIPELIETLERLLEDFGNEEEQ